MVFPENLLVLFSMLISRPIQLQGLIQIQIQIWNQNFITSKILNAKFHLIQQIKKRKGATEKESAKFSSQKSNALTKATKIQKKNPK